MGCLEDNEAHQDERLGDDVSCRFFVGRAPLLFGMSLRNRVGLHLRRARSGFGDGSSRFKMASHRECPLPAWDDSLHHVVDVHMPSPRYLQPRAVQCPGGQILPPSPNAG